ncbi:transcriptional regulator YkgD [Escherichia coli]|uniref:Transcriptional regulator YkgD n=1 Tax=Escherichia coli TaxID=562 RepID=A0A377DHL1_ECOLX|nr:transcriptional regulator YkgD [Escherichia coli]
MNRPVLSAALFGCNIPARYFLTSLPETLFLAPVNHSVEYNWLREAIPFLQQESRSAMPGVDALCSQICATFFTPRGA